jgi:hypothetical protein
VHMVIGDGSKGGSQPVLSAHWTWLLRSPVDRERVHEAAAAAFGPLEKQLLQE